MATLELLNEIKFSELLTVEIKNEALCKNFQILVDVIKSL